MATKAELNAKRPVDCPNWDTKRECGKAFRSGCRNKLCVDGKEQERQGKKASERVIKLPAKPSTITAAEYAARKAAAENAVRAKDTKSEDGNYIWHTEECCRRVWRRIGWGCVAVAR